MDRRQQLVALLLLACSGLAQAGYALVSPPSSFSTVGGVMQYQAAANDISVTNGVRGAAGSVNVGGRAITMPAAYRFAANAGRVAARAAFLNPAWMVAAVAGSALYQYYADQGFTVDNGAWKKTSSVQSFVYTSGYAECSSGDGVQTTRCALTRQHSTSLWSDCRIDSATGGWWYGSCYYTPNGPSGRLSAGGPLGSSSSNNVTPATADDFENTMAPLPIPAGVPQLLPVPLPVENPVLNPSADPVPLPRPMRVPMGDPQPVPNSSPPKWKTPVVDIVPSPDTPWQVDLQPKDIIKEDATPLPASDPVPATPPAGQTDEPVTPDLCEKNPDILACQKINLGTLEPAVVVHTDKSTSITKDTGWGPDNGICPAPRSVQLIGGTSVSFPFDLLCQFASGIRPIVIALAWLAAALAFIGFARRD